MKLKIALSILAAILAAAVGICWLATPGKPTPKQMYEEYMGLSPCTQLTVKQELLTKAAYAGYLPAIHQMARETTINGPQKELQRKECLFWLKKGADMGDPEMQYELFCVTSNNDSLSCKDRLSYLGKSVEQNYAPSLAAMGEIHAKVNNGHDRECNYERYGFKHDPAKALEYYRRAAAAGHTSSLYLLYLLDKKGIVPLPAGQNPKDVYDHYFRISELAGERPYEAELSAEHAESFLNSYYPLNPNN